MNDKPPVNSEHTGQGNSPSLQDPDPQDRHGQATGQLLRLLVGKLLELNDYRDPVLGNNLRILHRALCQGASVLHLHTLLNDISAGIIALDGPGHKDALEGAGDAASKDSAHEEQIKLICDVFVVLLDNINFPARFRTQIDAIKWQISKPDTLGIQSSFLTGMTNLAEVLDDIFDAVKQDRKNIENYLKQLTFEIKSLDEGIVASNRFQSEKQQAEDSINSRVETEVQEMESNMITLVDLEDVKSSLQKSLGTIRVHMEKFKQQERLRNLRANEVTDMLGKQLRKMEQECRELKKQILEKHEQVLSDSLTGVRNRFAYEEAIRNEMERFKRYARPVSILILDLDNFKPLNDTYGHGAGDKALIFVTRVLAKNIRSVDFLARYGGDELVIIFPELSLKEAKITADKLCKTMAASRLEYEGLSFNITVSGGVAQLHADDTAESLFERADAALYVAKERGRNRCEAKPH